MGIITEEINTSNFMSKKSAVNAAQVGLLRMVKRVTANNSFAVRNARLNLLSGINHAYGPNDYLMNTPSVNRHWLS